jgi:hypothetical protein
MGKANIEQFEQLNRPKGLPCGMWTIIHALDGTQLDSLNEALATPSISPRAIATVLGRWGHSTSHQIVYRHRSGLCSCAQRAESEAK